MSGEPKGPLSAIMISIAESIAEHQAQPPYEKNVARAELGAALLTLCAYAAITLGSQARDFPPLALAGWAGCVALGLLWLGLGTRNARGPRDVMMAFWAAVVAGGCIWLLWIDAYPTDWGPLAEFLLKGCYLAVLVSSGVRFWLAARGMPAQRLPDPETMPDLPMSGPASRDEAHDAMSGRGRAPPPRFRT